MRSLALFAALRFVGGSVSLEDEVSLLQLKPDLVEVEPHAVLLEEDNVAKVDVASDQTEDAVSEEENEDDGPVQRTVRRVKRRKGRQDRREDRRDNRQDRRADRLERRADRLRLAEVDDEDQALIETEGPIQRTIRRVKRRKGRQERRQDRRQRRKDRRADRLERRADNLRELAELEDEDLSLLEGPVKRTIRRVNRRKGRQDRRQDRRDSRKDRRADRLERRADRLRLAEVEEEIEDLVEKAGMGLGMGGARLRRLKARICEKHPSAKICAMSADVLLEETEFEGDTDDFAETEGMGLGMGGARLRRLKAKICEKHPSARICGMSADVLLETEPEMVLMETQPEVANVEEVGLSTEPLSGTSM